jgi:hypothetical protein
MRTWIAIPEVHKTGTTFHKSGKPLKFVSKTCKILTKDIFVNHAACMAGIAFDRVTEKLL